MRVYYIECSKPLGVEVLDRYPYIQVLDAGRIAGREHIEYALSQAEKAFQRGSNISGDPLIEAIVRASAQRQIKKALEIFGVKKSRKVYIMSEELPSELLSEYGCMEKNEDAITEEKYKVLKETYGIGEKEISAVAGEEFEERVMALKNIIKERIALLEAS